MRKLILIITAGMILLNAGLNAQEKTRLSVFPFENKSDKFYDWMGYGFSYFLSEALNAANSIESVPLDSIYNAEGDPNINLKNIYDGTVSPSFQLYHLNWKTNYALLGNFTVTGDTAIEINYKISLLHKKALSQPHNVKGKFGKYTDVYLTYVKLMESVFADLIGFDLNVDRPSVEKSHDKLRNMIADYDGLHAYMKKWLSIKHYDAAIRMTEERNYDRAVDYFNQSLVYDEYKALNISQNLSKTYVLRAATAFSEKNLESAEKDYKLAISSDSTNADAYYNLGNVYKEKNDFDQSEFNYQKALSIHPAMTAAYVNLGYVFNQQGDFNAAVKTYEKAKSLDGNNALILYYLGVAYDNSSNVNQAKQNYEDALKIDSTLSGALLNLGIIYKQSKDINKAKTLYQRALTYDPNNALAHRNLGIVLMNDKKEVAQAVFHLEKTLELEPNQDDAVIIKKNIDVLKKKLPKKKKK